MSPEPSSTRTPLSAARSDVLAITALLSLVAFAYAPVSGLGFVPLDDPLYITGNVMVQRGLTLEGLQWAFTTFSTGNWHPLTWLSHMADVQWFGLEPVAHHWGNVALHALNSVLLFLWLSRSTKRRGVALVVAALFAAHPLRVESVAWISERKDLLAGCFWLVALLFYRCYVTKPRWSRMAPVAVAMALSLMAKPMAVTLPFVLLLLDYWPHRRLSQVRGIGPQLVWEKIPLFALSAAASAVAILSQRSAGAVQSLQSISVDQRVAQACVAYVSYLGKTLWPQSLAAFYPHPALVMERSDFLVRAGLSALLLVGICIVALRVIRRTPAVAVGWGWYLGTLVPVIGLVQVGNQAMADRYTYLPVIGALVAAVMLATAILPRRGRGPAMVIAIVLAVALAALTRQQVRVWENGRTLYEHAIAVTESNEQALAGLGVVLLQEGDVTRGGEMLERALRINPNLAVAQHSLGLLAQRRGDTEEARARFERAIQLKPRAAEPRTALGDLHRSLKDFELAEADYRGALEVDAAYRPARAKLARLLRQTGRLGEARTILETLIREQPADLNARQDLALTALDEGDDDAALQQLELILQADPGRARAHFEIAGIYMRRESLALAREHLEEARRLAPGVDEIRKRLEEVVRKLGRE